jgi:predicted kinase
MGLPGAGKTTVAKAIEKLTGSVRLSSDEARFMIWPEPEFSEAEHQQLYEYLDDQTTMLLQAGRSVVYDANLNRYEHRQEKYQLAAELGVEVILCWVKTPSEVALDRRIHDTNHHHLVPKNEDPESMFKRVASVIEEPLANEKFVEFDGTKITPEYVAKKLNLT